jgi:hypothetical protein
MLEPCVNQAAGLQGLALQPGTRLVAVASHGSQQGEMPLLWSLCAAWVDLGFAVTVLDGQASESVQNPGLKQLLDDPMGRVFDEHDPLSWSVLAASQGLRQLASRGLSLDNLGALFPNFGVILIYADAPTLALILKGSGIAPLLVVAPLKASSLTAYQALKQLLLDAQLQPTVANIALATPATTSMQIARPFQHLQDCAKAFLGYSVKPLTVTAGSQSGIAGDGVGRLALQLLENAKFLERHPITRAH